MKKILALICAVVMVLCLAGCGKSIQEAKVGDIVEFGKYDGHNIEWIVVKEEGGKKLLLSKYAIGIRNFYKYGAVDSNQIDYVRNHFYSFSDISKYLDRDFPNDCFTDEEAERVVRTKIITKVKTTKNEYQEESWHSIFLPVREELGYLYIKCQPASYAKTVLTLGNWYEKEGKKLSTDMELYKDNCYYWTRKAFLNDRWYRVVCISPSGSETVSLAYCGPFEVNVGIRPMMWVKCK